LPSPELVHHIPGMVDTSSAPDVIRRPPGAEPDLLFYDGTCGLCHRWVLLALRHDPEGTRFRFAPIGGVAWNQAIPVRDHSLPDSLVLRTADGRTLVRSDAVLHVAERMGGGYRIVARGAGLLPRWLLDIGYDMVARIRKRLFAPPPGACPILPANLKSRFLR
jgi:predicted DCC family thiol-disulfide oxidoreductase YuxK